jgi:RHS repeat-associated protein
MSGKHDAGWVRVVHFIATLSMLLTICSPALQSSRVLAASPETVSATASADAPPRPSLTFQTTLPQWLTGQSARLDSPPDIAQPAADPPPPSQDETETLPPVANLGLGLRAESEWAEKGKPLSFVLTVSNLGTLNLSGIRVSVAFPSSLSYVSSDSERAIFDERLRTLFWDAGDVAIGRDVVLRFTGAVGPVASGILTLDAEAAAYEVSNPVRRSLRVGIASLTTISPEGGSLSSPDGKILVSFPAGAVSTDVQVTLAQNPLPGSRMAYSFQLLAHSVADQLPVTRFSQPLTLVAAYSSDERAAMRWNATAEFRPDIWWLNEDTDQWEPLNGKVNLESRTITATLDHFTQFGVGGGGTMEPGPLPSLNGYQVNLFTGAATASYPFELPNAKGGLVPNLGLTYSSSTADDQRLTDEVTHNLIDGAYGHASAQPSDVGEGWSLELAAVTRNTNGAPLDNSLHEYNLSLNGASFRLVYSGTIAAGREYRTDPDQFWKVLWANWDNQGTWYVTTSDGTRYTFDNRANFQTWDASLNRTEKTYRWSLTEIRDTNSNTATFTYSQEQRLVGPQGYQGYYTHAVHLTQVSYGGAYTVDFTYLTNRADYNTGWANDAYAQTFYSTQRLSDVTVKASDSQVRRYALAHGQLGSWSSTCPVWMRLTGIQVHGKTDAQVLPSTVFTYTTYVQDHCQYPTEPKAPEWLLYQADNGYGGTVTYDYAYFFANYQMHVRAGNCPADCLDVHRYRATTRKAQDGRSNYFQREYAYATPAGDNTYGKELYLGHGIVTETVRQKNSTTLNDAISVHSFYQKVGNDIDPRQGREHTTVSKTGTDTTLRTASQVWNYDTLPMGTRFVRLERSVITDTGASGITTRYYYETDKQGNQQLGNLTKVEEYGTGANAYRTTENWYSPNLTAWIVDKVAQTKVYTGTPGASWAAWTQYLYDSATVTTTVPVKGNLTAEKRTADGSVWISTSYRYDTYGNLDQITDPNNRQTTAVYDTTYHAYVTSVTNALSQTTTYAYDYVLGRLTSETGPNGSATTISYAYDDFGRITKVIRPGDNADYPTAYHLYCDTCTPFRIVSHQRVTSGGSTIPAIRFYDGLGQLIQENIVTTDRSDMTVRNTTYNAQGLVDKAYLPYTATYTTTYQTPDTNQPKTSYAYDALGRTKVITNTDGTAVLTDYNGLTKTVVDENSHQKVYENDALGRLVTVKEYTGTYPSATLYATTTYAYSTLDLLTTVTDAASNQTTMTYDALGRKTAMTDPDMGAWQYRYDYAGNLTKQRDARNKAICFYYDSLNRLVGKTYHDSSNLDTLTCPGTPYTIAYTYDAYDGSTQFGRGYRTGMTDTSGSAAWKYDTRGRVSNQTKTIDSTNYTTQWTYNSADLVVTQVYPGSPAETVTTAYDKWGRPSTLTGSNTYVTSATYDVFDRLDVIQFGNGQRTDYDYYPMTQKGGRLYEIKTGSTSPYTGTQYLRYDYDSVGNVSGITDFRNANQVQSFTYDHLDRLTAASTNAYGDDRYSDTYSYNTIGNLMSQARAGSYIWPYTYTTSVSGCSAGTPATKPHAVSQAGTYTFTYDCNGNMTSRNMGSSFTLTYDSENRLTSVSGGAAATFVYDGDGNRVKGVVGGVTTRYVGTYFEAGTAWAKYYYFAGKRVAVRDSTGLTYIHGDHLGSATNTTGISTKTQRYYPWGARRSSEEVVTPYRFTGQREEGTIGLYFYSARWYDAVLGRFTQPDTIVPEPGNPQSLNRYAYTLNNPVKYTDPTGHHIFEEDPDDPLYYAREPEAEGGQLLPPMRARFATSGWLRKGSLYRTARILEPRVVGKPTVAAVRSEGIGVVTAGAALLALVSQAARLSRDNTDVFMDDVSSVLTGLSIEETRRSGNPGAPGQYYVQFPGSSGLQTEFRDPDSENPQVRHLWFFVQLSYETNAAYATAVNFYHEALEGWGKLPGQSIQDWRLSLKGIDLGWALATQQVGFLPRSPRDVPSWLRSDVLN